MNGYIENELMLQGAYAKRKVYIPKPDPLTYPLCFTAVENDSTVKLNKTGSPADISLEYSYDNNIWTTYTVDDTISLNSKGAKVFFRGNNSTFSSSSTNYYRFAVTGGCDVSGNIASLHDTTLTSLTVPANSFFCRLFSSSNSKIINAKDLVMPYTTLKSNCFNTMFGSVSTLLSIPRIDAVSAVQQCFYQMFYGCSGITGEIRLGFSKLNGLQCCYSMFHSCTHITSAIVDATAFSSSAAAQGLFYGCSRLSRIEVNITAWQNCTNWVQSVASSGTFVCPEDLPETRGVSAIPNNWTIVRK